MRYGSIIGHWQTGMLGDKAFMLTSTYAHCRLLQAPFDFSQAFDQALRNVASAHKEQSADTVSSSIDRCVQVQN